MIEFIGVQILLFRRILLVSLVGGGSVWIILVYIVMVKEQKVVEEKVLDIIVFGLFVFVVMIFVIVVVGIVWWNYKFNLEEYNRLVVFDYQQG